MSSGTTPLVWERSQTAVTQPSRRSGEQAGPLEEQARSEAYLLWQRIESILPHAREQRIAYLLFHCGLTPHEIVSRCTHEFGDIQEVLSIRCVILKKLVHIV